ncbi:cysteine hydrolase [Paenibacillus hemerocallicola]|uniref:Cysteine hydrolase n=1 Tax=Paenibacillus hemerocallicola TaxID=1172614 RepID=A0A5C4T5L7_9BACL|nr:isochorismatase family cysteine hydrolase [Paenibacillus hemerocallicola]TNJ63617.1 cysteine hydrolase [Paenibacillus hemerocallicola]
MSYTSPNWNTSILITIDTQNDFTLPDAPAEIKGTSDVLPEMRQLLEAYREKGWPILHVVRLYKEDGSNVDICRKEIIEKGARIAVPETNGAELVEELRPSGYNALQAEKLLNGEFQSIGEKEWVMYKSRWGAFYKTDLEPFLHEQGVDTLVFTGCNFPNCPRTSMYEASERDFRVVMVSDSMSQVYEKGIQEMKNIGVYVCELDQVIESISDDDVQTVT